MALPFNEKLLMLVPPPLYYRRRIENEIRTGEPELAILGELMPNGGTAIDVGANQGFFAFALSEVADRVVSFEANPDYARFARWMLRGRAEVHEVAISDQPGRATFYVPLSDEGMVLHFAGNLKQTHSQFKNQKTYDVELRTLDSYGIENVRFIKVDVEGSEREVLDGAKAIIARDRPGLLLELLSGTHADPGSYAKDICDAFGYDCFVVQKGQRLPGLQTIASLGKNTSWGTEIETRNVLFLPR
jgi:FkbM family methyltransferase